MADEPELGIGIEREVKGRFIGEIVDLPGLWAYGATAAEATAAVEALALYMLFEGSRNGEAIARRNRERILPNSRRHKTLQRTKCSAQRLGNLVKCLCVRSICETEMPPLREFGEHKILCHIEPAELLKMEPVIEILPERASD